MRCHAFPFWLLIAAAGCQVLGAGELPTSEPATEPAPVMSPARRLWEQGQGAMRLGQPDRAIACYTRSLQLDPGFTQAHLSLAAAHLEISDDAGACPHLGRYVEARPQEVVVRGHYAELLYRLGRRRDARKQFDRFVVDAQEQGGPAQNQLIHCHSRLMQIAEVDDDTYAEHLNRGIGLLLLARARAALLGAEPDLTRESFLCKAAGELTLAREERPDEARPCWYLYEVWSFLAQRSLASRWLRETQAAASFSYLTPAERCSLQLTELSSATNYPRR